MKITMTVEIDVQPYTRRVGKGLDCKDVTCPMSEYDAREAILTYFKMANADRCQINGHSISFDTGSIR